ncbi:EF-hand domain-containing protein [Vannielia litorea]|uniref:EF-hand domain-containing protein n=1 Tax=Vannielia TaxID=2813041 RepID=UPI001BCC2D9F|nr:EF-hand domain-containing protein [Vannielia litorea]MBS8227803.1 EF-hand domain-containing protein [Vannielia litorea]MBY6049906.1 EF-hand domain-containing protein [Vannielia litorea]MBY6077320.1 EF-hand domain-containing protein [Vannielia litorea]MBY6155450.1 EF-hand domain-containing protein [Vannielia litorea]
MTKITMTAAALAALLAAPLAAQDAPMVEDTDGNGTFSMEEMQVAYPDITEEIFTEIDTSADGEVDTAEWEAAVGAGLLTSG